MTNFDVTGEWKTNIGKTLVVQPGQMLKTRFVVFDIKNQSINAELVEI